MIQQQVSKNNDSRLLTENGLTLSPYINKNRSATKSNPKKGNINIVLFSNLCRHLNEMDKVPYCVEFEQ